MQLSSNLYYLSPLIYLRNCLVLKIDVLILVLKQPFSSKSCSSWVIKETLHKIFSWIYKTPCTFSKSVIYRPLVIKSLYQTVTHSLLTFQDKVTFAQTIFALVTFVLTIFILFFYKKKSEQLLLNPTFLDQKFVFRPKRFCLFFLFQLF